LSLLKGLNIGTNFFDGTRNIDARDDRKLQGHIFLEKASPELSIDGIDPGEMHFD